MRRATRMGAQVVAPLALVIALVIAACSVVPRAPQAPSQADTHWSVQREGRLVWLETDRWKVALEDGLVVHFLNKLTGETHARRGAAAKMSLPAGLGVQTGALDAARQLHILWGSLDLNQGVTSTTDRFPSQHRPYAKSVFTFEQPNRLAAIMKYKGLAAGDKEYPDEIFELKVALDQTTADLLLTASGSSSLGGVYGAMVCLSNINKDTIAHVAHFGGVRFNKDWPKGQYSLQDGGPFLEAPVVALEGESGSWAIWSEDPSFGPKGLYWQNTPEAFHLLMESRNLSPFDSYKEVKTVTWRVNCFRGSWVAAAKPYHDWFRRTFAEDLASRTPEWAKKIRVFCECLPTGDKEMDAIASALDPSTVMLHAWAARRPDFDTQLPDFTPRQTFIDSVKLAHERGFHTSAYVNTYCINKDSPYCKTYNIQDFALYRTPLFQPQKTLADWKEGAIIYVDPLSTRWRDFHARSMKEFVEATQTDSLYEDTAGCSGDHGNGVVDGIYAGRGSYEALRAVRQVLPGVPFSTEYNTSPIAPFSAWPLRGNYAWGNETFREVLCTHAAPFEAYLFGPDVLAWTMVHRTAATQVFHRAVDYADAMGGLAWIYGPAWVKVTRGDQALALHRAKLFSKLQLKPYFPESKWEPNVVCYYQDTEGKTYTVIEQNGQALVGPEGQDLYRRTRGLAKVRTNLIIPGWPAYDADGPIGLNPKVKYSLIAGSRSGTKLTISALSSDACIESYREGEGYVLLTLEQTAGATVPTTNFTYRISAPAQSVIVNGSPIEPQSDGQSFVLSVPAKATVLWILGAAGTPDRDGFVGAGTEDGLIIADGLGLAVDAERRSLLRFKTEKGPATLTICPSAGVQLALDYLVTVPSPASVLRVFGMHRKEKHGNGMTAKFLVNGKEIFSTPMPREDDRWHQWDIPLGASAGKWRRAPWRPGRSPALITLIANCNGDTNCDNMRLTRPRIVEDASVTGPRHQVLEGAK